ncbi:MAG: GAF domain-containing protein [Candidatus Rokubacteria bacterium]|nr:GAF domain-containing protein [Candidatus Rokubacteria bacterium]
MHWTIQRKLTALVLVVLLPLLAGVLLEFRGETWVARERAQEELLATAQSVARQLDAVLSGQIENLDALVTLRGIERLEDGDLAAFASRVRVAHPFVRELFTAGADGRLLAVSGSRAVGATPSVADRADFRAVMQARAPRVGGPQPGVTDPRLAVPILVPALDRQGTSLGVAVAEIDLAALSAFLEGAPRGQRGEVAVLTAAGTVVARTGAEPRQLGRPLSSEPASLALIRQGNGVAEWRWEDGQTRLAGAAAMPRTAWVVVATMASELTSAAGGARLLSDLRWVALVTLLALLAASVISRRMNRSVQALIAGARGLAEGEGAPIVVPTRDELAELAERFNRSVDTRRAARAALEARQRGVEALAEVNLGLSRQLELEPLLKQVTDALARLTGARNVVLWGVEDRVRRLVRRACTCDAAISLEGFPESLAFGEGATGWIADNRRPLVVDDVTGDARMYAVPWARAHGLLVFAGVPVLAADELVGVLTLNLDRGHVVDDDERALLVSFASQAAVALRNAQIFARTEARRRMAETLADLGRTLAQALDPDVVARQVVDHVRGLLRVHSSALFQLDPQSGDLVALAVTGEVGPTLCPGLVFPRGMGAAGLAVQSGLPVVSRNVLTDARITLNSEMREAIERSAHRAVLTVPLTARGTVVGALSVGDREDREFDAEEIGLLQAFADAAALALDNARLHEQTRQRLRHLDSLREVVEQILEPLSLEDRLNVITRNAAELVGGDRATLALMAPAGDGLEVRAGYKLFQGELGSQVALGQGGLGVAADTREGVLVTDYQGWPHRSPLLVARQGEHPILGAIAYPLLVRDQVIGALSVGTCTPGKRFSAADVDRLASLAGPAALAIEHSRLYQELEARLSQLQETQAQLVQAAKLSAVGQLVSGVAHELNNPLSVVMGHSQLLLSKELPPALRRPLEQILAQGARMAKIVQGLLLFSRQRKRTHEAVSLPRIIEQTLALRADQLRLSGIRVEVEHAADLPPAAGDAHQLQQVFLNLLLNAEQAIAGPGGGDRISIRSWAEVERGKPRVRVEVSDNGPGIPPDVLPRIFDPFFTTKAVGKGTGLGLSVSYGIIEQHGGRLIAESRPGHTVFTVELPAMAEAAAAAPAPPAPPPRAAGLGRRALVVDDEPFIVDFLTALLQESGWEVDACGGGRAALECVRHGRYDLVISDMRMAEGTGEELYRAVAVQRRELARRFLFITGDTANPQVWKFLEEVGVPVLAKPFSADALLRAVQQLTA